MTNHNKRIKKLLYLMGLCLLCSGCGKQNYQFDAQAIEGSLVLENPDQMKNLQQKAEESTFRMQVNSNPQINAQTMRGGLMIANPIENDKDIYVTIYLEDTLEVVYESDQLQPGERIAYGILNRTLAPGDYPAVAAFSLVDEEGDRIISGFEAAVLISVVETDH